MGEKNKIADESSLIIFFHVHCIYCTFKLLHRMALEITTVLYLQ